MLTAMQHFLASVGAPSASEEAPAAAAPGAAALAVANPNASMQMLFMPNPLAHPSTAVQSNTVLTVSRYGRIYKRRKTNEDVLRKYAAPPGHRYCTYCKCALPLSAFYTKVKRYVCIRHHVQRVGTYFRRRCIQTDNLEIFLEEAVDDLLDLCPFIGYKTAEYDMKDLAAIISQCGIPMRITPRAVPIDPSIPMRPRNVAVLSRQNMMILSQLFLVTNSRAAFIWFAQCCNLIPRNADSGVPEDVFHNPQHQRKDIDVSQILLEERGMPAELPALDVYNAVHAPKGSRQQLLAFAKPTASQRRCIAATTTTGSATGPSPTPDGEGGPPHATTTTSPPPAAAAPGEEEEEPLLLCDAPGGQP